MNKQIPEIKEAIEKIDVPIDKLDKTIDIAMKRVKTQHKKPIRKLFPIIGVASLSISLLIGSAFVSPAMAKVLSAIPVLNSVFDYVGDKGLEIASKEGLSKKISQTATDKNISLTIQDFFFDGTRLSISYFQEFPDQWGDLGELDLKVDGKRINFSDSRTGKMVSDHQYAGVINIKEIGELPDSFDLSIGLKEIGGVKGHWNFEIPVKISKEDVKTIQSGITKIYQGVSLKVKTVSLGPAGIKLLVDVTSPIEKDPNGIDERLLQINLLNSQGEALTKLDGSGSGEVEGEYSVTHWEYRFAPLEKSTEFLTVSPFFLPFTIDEPSRVEQPLQKNSLPIALDQGEMGKMIVTDVKYEKDKTLLYFEVVSDFPYDGHFQFNNIWIEDQAGNNLTMEEKGYPERIKQNSYVQEFKQISENEILKVVTYKMPILEVLEELEVKIPLK